MRNTRHLWITILCYCISIISAAQQVNAVEIIGWLRFDSRMDEANGICTFSTQNPEEITLLYPHPIEEVACAGAYANGKYYVYLYSTDGIYATPLYFGTVNLRNGLFTKIADYYEMTTLFADMTYDYTTHTMYALGNLSEGVSSLLKVNLENGSVEQIAALDRLYISLACSYDGELYAVDGMEGYLFKIDKSSGVSTSVGYTFEEPDAYAQSMEFDHESGALYWAGYNIYGEAFLAAIDTASGESKRVGYLGKEAQVLGLYIPFEIISPDAPSAVVSLTAQVEDTNNTTLTWKNPRSCYSGASLQSLTSIEIYRNDTLIHTMYSPQIGMTASYTDTRVGNGLHYYKIIPVNEAGRGESTEVSVFVGHDVPAAPTSVVASLDTQGDILLQWEAPSVGINGGKIDASSLTYQITRMPDTVVVVQECALPTFTDTTIEKHGSYFYKVEAHTQQGKGGVGISNAVVAGPALEVPYFCNFATDEDFVLWNVEDSNNDDYTWRRETTLDAAYYYYSEIGNAADDWLISYPIALQADKKYRVNFKLQSYGASLPEKVEVFIGQGRNADDMKTSMGVFVARSEEFVTYSAVLPEIASDGNYNIGFHCISDADMFILYLTDVLVEEVYTAGITGVVTDGNTPIAEVQVTVDGSGRSGKTDRAGKYTVTEIPAGLHTVTFEKLGYITQSISDVAFADKETSTLNIDMEAMPTYTLTGNVTNMHGKLINGGEVVLSGYNTYRTTTDAEGRFEINGIFHHQDYCLSVHKYGMQVYEDTLDITSQLSMLQIALQDKPIAPYLLQCSIVDGTAHLQWQKPKDTAIYRHDNGRHNGRLGKHDSTRKSIYGSVFREPTRLTGAMWFTENYLQTHDSVDFYIFDLDANGNPTSTILYTQRAVPNVDMQWTTIDFEAPVDAPNGYMLGIGCDGHVGLGLDDGGEPYPFVERTHCFTDDYETGKFSYIEDFEIMRSLMIRGIGLPLGADEQPSFNTTMQYKVYVLADGMQNDKKSWSLLSATPVDDLSFIDTAWSNLPQGFYRYAVETIYGSGVISEPAFTEVQLKDMFTHITINVGTNTPENEAEGAVVTLINNTDTSKVYTAIVSQQGVAVLDSVWKDNYNVAIELKGFYPYKVDGLDFSSQPSYSTPKYMLDEYIVEPFALDIDPTGIDGERLFSWSMPNYIFDDFEEHTDFAINSAGKVGWSYLDGDGDPTYGMDGVYYPNATSEMAFMIFNPYETDPGLGIVDPAIRPYSGEKFLAGMVARYGANDDYIISPVLSYNSDFTLRFYAKSYTGVYGADKMNVGYSIDGKNANDFIWLNGDTPVEVGASQWQEFCYTIPANAKYVAINYVADDTFIFMVDDIFIGMEMPEGIEVERMKDNITYEVYLDNEKIATTTQRTYTFAGLSKGSHTAAVRAIYSSGTTELVSTIFHVEEDAGIDNMYRNHITVYPNPTSDVINISGEYDYVEVYDVNGRMLKQYTPQQTISLRAFDSGVYMLRIVAQKSVITHKILLSK